MENETYPLVLKPVVLEKPWGATGKGPDLVSGISPDLKIGEVWLTADGEYQSTIENGFLAGMTLKDLRLRWGDNLLGHRFAHLKNQPFPLLLKFIHAAEYLSVQVHPDDQTAEKLEGVGPGKTEAWYILEAAAGAELILGLEPGVSRAALSEALKRRQIEKILHRVKPRPSDIYYVQAGLLHAIGPGITLFEIQQNVDLTYRFYDWERKDDQGRFRELHVSKAMEALKVSAEQAESFSGLSYEMGGVRVTAMAAGRYFALERWELTSDYQGLMDGSRFDVLTVIAGQGRIETLKPDQTVSLNRGTTVLFPAALGAYQILPSPELVLLRSFVPDLEADVVLPLRKRGFYLADIRKLAGWRRPNDLSIFSENNK